MNNPYFTPLPIRPVPRYPDISPPIPIPPPPQVNATLGPITVDDLIMGLLERRNSLSNETIQRIYSLINFSTTPLTGPSPRVPIPRPRPIMYNIDEPKLPTSTQDITTWTFTNPIDMPPN